ncbi:hypothetical protein L1N85_18585 [Paenibacillus alkaliterrae]|uniref:hypothetical protein n=1 Tax=Paenibacillus alkaliterrae TaxID=320909 RepID=UPI001F4401AF|nr:hypothetical protein [Paenibacillus alkaliterrae]MCF2940411.1 hypothetical protein [Paenibacillus alkaliterrae]
MEVDLQTPFVHRAFQQTRESGLKARVRPAPFDDDVVHAHLWHYDLPAHGCVVREPERGLGQAEIHHLPFSRLNFKNRNKQTFVLTLKNNIEVRRLRRESTIALSIGQEKWLDLSPDQSGWHWNSLQFARKYLLKILVILLAEAESLQSLYRNL